MPARIMVIRDGETQKVVPIEKISSRIGGAAPSDIILTGLPPHVFSVEFHEDTYWIQNTGNETLYLDESVIPRGSQMAWEAGETLQAGKWLTLELAIEGDPAPKLQRASIFGIRPKELLTEAEKNDRDHQLKLAFVLAISLLGILFFAYQIVFTTTDYDRATRLQFNGILSELGDKIEMMPNLKKQQSERDELTDLQNALKRARVAELDNDPEMAAASYAAIRNQLRTRYQSASADFTDPVFEAINDFVWDRQQIVGFSKDDQSE